MIEVNEDQDPVNNQCFYLPHHAVIKLSSSTTQTRVVFDASAKSSSGISLNDTLMVGPTIQDDLFSIMIRSRKYHLLTFQKCTDKLTSTEEILIYNEFSGEILLKNP